MPSRPGRRATWRLDHGPPRRQKPPPPHTVSIPRARACQGRARCQGRRGQARRDRSGDRPNFRDHRRARRARTFRHPRTDHLEAMRSRSAWPLPRYVRRKPLKSGWAYFFEPPTCARKAGCPVEAEALGSDYNAAVLRAETILLPQLDAWWRGSDDGAHTGPTLDWMFAEYRADRRYTRLDVRTKRKHETGFRLVGGYVMTDGRKLGTMPLAAITTAVTDALYEKLLIIRETDATGNVIERERRTTVNHAMKSCRRAWNVARRRNPGKVPLDN